MTPSRRASRSPRPRGGTGWYFLLIHDSGFEIYAQPLVVRAVVLEELRPCLELVVPIFQQGVLDHYADPGPTDAVILQIGEDLASVWVR